MGATTDVVVADEISIARAAPDVWRFVYAPETAVITAESVIKGFTVPGTPRGEVGEQQCFFRVRPDGVVGVDLIEVTHLVPGACAVAVSLSFRPAITTTTRLEDRGAFTLLGVEYSCRAPSVAARSLQTAFSAGILQYLTRVKHALESGGAEVS